MFVFIIINPGTFYMVSFLTGLHYGGRSSGDRHEKCVFLLRSIKLRSLSAEGVKRLHFTASCPTQTCHNMMIIVASERRLTARLLQFYINGG